MERGAIPLTEIPGGIDLQLTLESGQSYLWTRRDGAMYTDFDGSTTPWYEFAVDGTYLCVRQTPTALEWRGTAPSDPATVLRRRLRLDDDLDVILEDLPSVPPLDTAIDAYRGMRIVRDPLFGCLISFICSAQMRVERIYRMQQALATEYGRDLDVGDRTVHTYPTPESLAAATESDLRSLKLGYRAPYVRETSQLVADGTDPATVLDASYETARSELTVYPGVGPKIADCVLLFSLGYLEAVPLDTWIRTAIETHFPDCDKGSYADTSRAIRSRLGGEHAGYAQTYLFHYLRTADSTTMASKPRAEN